MSQVSGLKQNCFFLEKKDRSSEQQSIKNISFLRN